MDNTYTCPDCGAVVPEGSKTCPKCNASLDEYVCTDCGAVVSESATVCPECGAALEEEQEDYKEQSTRSRYTALRTVGTIYGILGWLTLASGMLLGLFGVMAILSSKTENKPLWAFLSCALPLLGGAIIALPMLASQDIVTLITDIASDSRMANLLLSKLVSEQKHK